MYSTHLDLYHNSTSACLLHIYFMYHVEAHEMLDLKSHPIFINIADKDYNTHMHKE
jgi:hypothetical protein